MAYIQREFNKYTINYWSQYPYEAELLLSMDSNFIGKIVFVKDDDTNHINTNAPWLTVHFPISKFNDVVSILREEKPLYISLNTELKSGTISTSIETIGENEGHS